MNKKGGLAIWISIALAFVLVIGLFIYFSLTGQNYDDYYKELTERGLIVNPALELSTEDAVAKFNETFVYYLLYSIKAYNLHNLPLSPNKPKIEIHIDDKIYNSIIDSGEIIVNRGQIEDEDIVIKTSAVEAVMMMQDKNHIYKSFKNGESKIELVASKSVLFGKGYLKLYGTLKGDGMTGNVIKMYLS